MASVDIKKENGQSAGKAELDAQVFSAPVREGSMHAVVVAQLAARRAGTHATRNRALIRGGGRKPFRQKGTGRARQGSRRSPLMRGGATVFGPQPRDYSVKVNKKVRAGALRSALTVKAQESKLHILDALDFQEYKTKRAAALLQALGVRKALVVIGEANPYVERSFANLPGCGVIRAEGLNVYDILRHDNLIMTREALDKVVQRLNSAQKGE